MSTRLPRWQASYSKRLTRRRFVTGVSAGTAAVALIACGGGGEGVKLLPASSSREPGAVWFARDNWKLADETKGAVRGGIYRGSTTGDQPGHFDPITLNTSATPYAQHVYEHLMYKARAPGLDPKSPEAQLAVPGLASSWEFADAGTTIVFKLRQGVRFHNIPPVNARVMDIDDWRTSDQRFRETGQYRTLMPSVVDKSEFPDANTMVWKLSAPYAAIQSLIYENTWTYAIMPKELNANLSKAQEWPIGTNYKVLDRYNSSLAYEYKKHPDYWGGDPFIDRWHVPIIPEYANRTAQFMAQNTIDFTPTARDFLLLVKDVPNAVIHAGEIEEDNGTKMEFGVQNPQSFPWKDARVRQAMRQSINFRGIGELQSAKAQLEVAGIPIEVLPQTHVNKNPGFWLNPEAGELGDRSIVFLHDPADAKKRINAAGYTTPLELPYFMLAASDGQVADADQLVVDSIKQSGNWDVKVTVFNNDTAWRRLTEAGEFDGFRAQSGAAGEVDRRLFRQYHSQGNISRAPQPYPNTQLDAMIEAQRVEIDVGKRSALIKELQYFLADWMPQVPGRHEYTTMSLRWPWLHNIGYGNSGSPPSGRPNWGGHLQWLDKDMPSRNG